MTEETITRGLMIGAHGKQGNDLSIYLEEKSPHEGFLEWAQSLEDAAKGVRLLAESIRHEEAVEVIAENGFIFIHGLSADAKKRAIESVHDLIVVEEETQDEPQEN